MKNMLPVTAVEKSRIRSVLPGGSPMNMLSQHPLGDRGRCASSRCSTCRTRPCPISPNGMLCADDLQLVAVVVGDDVEREVRVGRLDRVVDLDVVELGAPDHPLLLLGRQRVPRVHVVHVLLDVHIAAAGEVGVLVADLGGGRRRSGPSGFSVPSTKPSRSRLSKNLKPCTSSTTVTAPAIASTILPASSKQTSIDSARMWNSRSPGVDGRVVPAALDLDERVQLGRARSGEQPVPRVGADRGDHREPLGRVAEPDGAHQPRDVGRARRGRFARRRRRWSPPERWPQASAAPEPVAAGQRAPSDPKSRSWAKMVNHVRECTGAVRVHRRVAVAVPRVRDGRAAAARGGLHRTVRTRRVADEAGGSSSCGPARWSPGAATASRRRRSASSAATPTAPTCGSSSIPTGSCPAGRWSRCSPTAGRG